MATPSQMRPLENALVRDYSPESFNSESLAIAFRNVGLAVSVRAPAQDGAGFEGNLRETFELDPPISCFQESGM